MHLIVRSTGVQPYGGTAVLGHRWEIWTEDAMWPRGPKAGEQGRLGAAASRLLSWRSVLHMSGEMKKRVSEAVTERKSWGAAGGALRRLGQVRLSSLPLHGAWQDLAQSLA